MKSPAAVSAICLFGACAAAAPTAAGAGIPPAGFERRAMLCDFEHGAAGWTVKAAEAGLSDEEPHSGEACVKIAKAPGAEFAEIRSRFPVHDSFEAIAVYIWHEPGEEPPLLWAVARDEYGAFRLSAMEPRDDPSEQEDPAVFATLGGWRRFAVSVSNLFAGVKLGEQRVAPSPTAYAHTIFQEMPLHPRYLEAIRLKPRTHEGTVIADDLCALLIEESVENPLYMAAAVELAERKPEVSIRVYNTSKNGSRSRKGPLRAEAEIRALGTPKWEVAAKASIAVQEPDAARADTGVALSTARIAMGGALEDGVYAAYIRLTEQESGGGEEKLLQAARIVFSVPDLESGIAWKSGAAEPAETKLRRMPVEASDEKFLIEMALNADPELALDAAEALIEAAGREAGAAPILFELLPAERSVKRARAERLIARLLGEDALRFFYETEWMREQGLAHQNAIELQKQESGRVTREALAGAHRAATAELLAAHGVKEIVFAVRQPGKDGHWYANVSHWSSNPNQRMYGDGGGLAVLNLQTGKLRWLVEDSKGGVRDPRVHYDGKKILFSYRKGGDPYYNLYETSLDGSEERRVTDAPYDDYEPAYLPDGGVVFVSTRANRWVPCWFTRVGVLHRCDADGGNIRRLSSNVEMENTPWVLPDGRIVYMRWEYVDRSQVAVHQLWTMNPDGTAQMTFFGNSPEMCPGVYLDAKPIPGSRRLVMTYSPGHGRTEGQGAIEIIDIKKGPDNTAGRRRISPPHPQWFHAESWREPFPLSETAFLAAQYGEILFMDGNGNTVLLYALSRDDVWSDAEYWAFSPQPVIIRPRESLIPSRVMPAKKTGSAFLEDVYTGRNMKGVKRGEIKKLLVLEDLPKPINFSGGLDPLGQFLLRRILGTVPVEPDGSAYFELPAERSLFFVALDENNISVKRMHSFMTVQRGEQVGCVGCHERRTHAPLSRRKLAAMRAPSRIEPFPGIPDVIDFPRDIQPILDKHCIDCHGYRKTEKGGPRAGGLLLTGHLGGMYFNSMSWTALRPTIKIAESEYRDFGPNYLGDRPPRSQGTAVSPLMQAVFEGEHHGVKLSATELLLLQLWIESSGTYAGTYAALGTWHIAMPKIPNDVFSRRCAACHKTEPIGYDFAEIEKSPVLLKPLNPAAGGWGMAKGEELGWVFEDTNDRDYKAILNEIQARAPAVRKTRFEFKEFEPSPHYLREMKWYGILKDGEPFDVYALDQAYWRSFWP